MSKLLAWRPGGYLRASGALFGWLAVRTAAQTALFVLVARTLGAEGYGGLIATLAIAGLFSCAAMGPTAVLVRDGARHSDRLPELIGDLFRIWAVAAPLLSLLAVGACALLLREALPIAALTAIAVAEVVCATAVDSIARLYQSQGRVRRMGAVSAGLILARFATFSLFMPLWKWTPEGWAFGYLVSSAIYLASLIVLDRRILFSFRGSPASLGMLIRKSFPFTFYNVAYKAQGEINKPALAHWLGFQGAGLFSAAHRFADLVAFPALALIEAMVPRVYKAAQPLKAAATLGLAPLGLALSGGVLLVSAAAWLPVLLGSSYQSSVGMTQALAGLPALLVVRVILGSVIAACNLQHLFVVVHGIGVIVLIVSLWILVPAFGALGAVVAAYAMEVYLIVAQLAAIYRLGPFTFVGVTVADEALRR